MTLREIQILCEQYGKISLKDMAFNNIGFANSMKVAGAVSNANTSRNIQVANSNFERYVNFYQNFINVNGNKKEDLDTVRKNLESKFGVIKNGVKQ